MISRRRGEVDLDGLVRRQRKPSLEGIETMLKGLRFRGVDKDALRRFVAEFGEKIGSQSLNGYLGYDSKLAARTSLSLG